MPYKTKYLYCHEIGFVKNRIPNLHYLICYSSISHNSYSKYGNIKSNKYDFYNVIVASIKPNCNYNKTHIKFNSKTIITNNNYLNIFDTKNIILKFHCNTINSICIVNKPSSLYSEFNKNIDILILILLN